ncbi:MAG: imidazole glycerol phosphate synthase, glutamine amidotransferase subunit [Bacteroidetes bacterium GWE2_29_8]|nr:MAG: imidazole glycerol phosphate synthase, glutamine amidotransferase subunit [Bacteroidetes bacterium GWE2_29_8]OFY14434.1 MAG: imidazole glycerol phosphate synthase, glutamine amidotransferase subunit [Bacteroidetes bacterium GWF2_29_10]
MGCKEVTIIKYNAGNVFSMQSALERLGVKVTLSDREDVILNSERVIFPGVGQAASAMSYLKSKGLDNVIKQIKVPFLGVCLGMQLLCSSSEEGDVNCLGIINAKVKKFIGKEKIPHTGWNNVKIKDNVLFEGISELDYFYFVHSYYAEKTESTIAECDYINIFSASINKDNYYGVQFHPEKSSYSGAKILANFINI